MDFEGPIHEVVLQRPIYYDFPRDTNPLYKSLRKRNRHTYQRTQFFFRCYSACRVRILLDAIHFCNLLSQQQNLQPCYEIHDTDVIWNQEANGYRLPTEA